MFCKGQGSEAACIDCTPGSICASPGLSWPTDLCDEGWYCTLGSDLAQPSDPEGGYCIAGEYCPLGSSEPLACDPGQYCDVDRMSAPRGPCDAGYYCVLNSTTPTPSGVGGNICSSGHYCLEGSDREEPCPPGYYLPSSGGQNISYCLECSAGSYCNASGLSQPSGLCDQGFYCPPAQTEPAPNMYPCPLGYYCETGSQRETICPSGTYQDELAQWTCKECLEGFYCDNSIEPVVNVTSYECPEGLL